MVDCRSIDVWMPDVVPRQRPSTRVTAIRYTYYITFVTKRSRRFQAKTAAKQPNLQNQQYANASLRPSMVTRTRPRRDIKTNSTPLNEDSRLNSRPVNTAKTLVHLNLV